MKKIAAIPAFFSLFRQCTIKATAGKTIPLTLLLLLCRAIPANSQQVIGTFPVMDGGFESATVATQASTTVATNTQLTNWTGANTSSVPAINTTIVRSGTKSLQWTTSSTSHLLFSKSANTTDIANATSYVVQFYWYKGYSGSARTFDVSVGPGGTTNMGTTTSNTLGVSAISTDWTKETVIVTTGTVATTPRYGLVRCKPNGGSFSSSPGYVFDDFCVYPGSAADNTAPGDVGSPQVTGYTATSLDLSWTAPGSGVDGGGYIVIRYAANPSSEPAPNTNGIYAVGSTIGSGTVVYIGTATGFTNTGLSANTAYYYRVYAVDKAFNYSPDPTVFAGFTGIAGPTAISFTTPATCLTDRLTITWTGPLNYAPGTRTILAFLKAGGAVTVGTPTNAVAAYTAATVFATGSAYQNDAAAYCIYKGDGTDALGDHSGLTITGLSPNTTYHILLFGVIDASSSYSAGSTGNGTTLNGLAEPANNPGSFAKGAVTTSNIPLTWAAAGGSPAPTGYLIKASNTSSPADPTDFTDPADQTNVSGGTANAKSTGTSYNGFTGFSAGTMYYFRINSYTNTSACINYKASGPSINVATLPNAVTSPLLDATGGVGNINWNTATGYNSSSNTTLVFVSSSPITINTPTANPSGYTANSAFGTGTAYQWDANAKCIYKGDGTSAVVTGLISGTTYYVLILTVVDAANYDATHSYSAYATVSALYTSTNEYTWIGGGSGSWAVATNWSPTRTTPAAADALVFNTAGAVTATNVPAQTIARLTINNGNVTLQSAAAATLTITDNNTTAYNDLIVSAATSLTLGSSVSITLSANTTANISGTLTVNSGNTYNTDNAGAITTINGTLYNSGTATCTAATRMIVNNGGAYIHNINGGTIPTATWNFNSSCIVTGITSVQNMNGHGQTYSKFIWDCAGQTNTHFVLGENINKTSGPYVVVTDSLIVKQTNGKILQLTSSGGQNNFTVGNYLQYGGIVAVTYNTDAGGEQRSLTVNNTFYVADSITSNAVFQIINNPGSTNNIIGRLYVKGNIEMHPMLSASTLEVKKDNSANPSVGELWFTGTAAQYARFSTLSGNIDFVTSHTGSGVNLLSNAAAYKFKLVQGTFFIGPNTLTINDAVSYPSPSTGTIGGSSTSNLTITDTAGTLNFYTGYRTLKDLTLTAGAQAALGTELGITAGISPGRDSLGVNATLTTNDNLILRSDINGTARQAQVPVNGSGVAQATIIGKVAVERYLPMGLNYDSRRWRLLTAPFKPATAPSIQDAWQEGTFCPDRNNPSAYDPKPGYGTHVTIANVAINGFDQGVQNNPSIFYYNNAANSWVAPVSSTGVKVTDNYGVYQLFVRGDRSIVIINPFVAAKPTTLDPKGELYLGSVTIPMLSSGFQPVGNPYASQVKLDNIDFNGTLGKSKTIYLWDPKALGSSGVGAFITCSGDGGSPATYTYTGNSSNYGSVPGVIESSGAFMVAATGGNIVFHEPDKTISSSTVGVASRPSSSKSITGSLGKISKLHIDLIGTRNGEPSLADGIAITYNKHYSNSIDEMDAVKLLTFATKERLSIRKEEGLYSIERRAAVNERDTIQLYIAGLGKATYTLDLRPVDFSEEFTAYIEDRFTKTSSVITLTGNSSFSFDITDDSLSMAADRLFITFRRNKPVANAETNNISIFPNPVKDGKLHIKMNGIEGGMYEVRLLNDLGQVVQRNRLLHREENTIEVLNVKNKIARGVYRLKMFSANNKIITTTVMIQ